MALIPAISIIKKYEGFTEKATADPSTGGEPYVIGFGTEFYPDGTPVQQGHRVSREKAHGYLLDELTVLAGELDKLNLDIDWAMQSSLLSFIHSIGWENFLYSSIIDSIEFENFDAVILEFYNWIFDADHKVVGGLIERRAEEAELFLTNLPDVRGKGCGILLKAFRDYEASKAQVDAIRRLESRVSPYLLSEFCNEFESGHNRLCQDSDCLIDILT